MNSYFYTVVFGLLLLLFVLLKVYNCFTIGVYKGKERLDGKTAIITGSNSGIGLETAKDFAKRGARVVMVCRDMKKAEKFKDELSIATGNTKIRVKHIDFLSLESVRKCAYEILSEEKRIDILVNNAGAVVIGLGVSDDGLGKLMQTNYFGPFLFTNILLGRIKDSSPSRIVNVSSSAYVLGKVDLDHVRKSNNRTSETFIYSDTKLANILFSNYLAQKLKGTGVTSNSLHPGVFASDILRNEKKILAEIWKFVVVLFCKTIKEGAQTSIYLSVSPDIANISGKYFENCKIVELWNNAKDIEIAKKLWDLTEDIVKLRPDEKHY